MEATNKRASVPELNYTCEICGREGFSDEEMRAHMVECHLEGEINCPFCDLSESSPAEMLSHVNSAHLDYLTPSTPENDVMAFIDEDSIEDKSGREAKTPDSKLHPPSLRNGWKTPTGVQTAASSKTLTSSNSNLHCHNNNNNNVTTANVNAIVSEDYAASGGHGSPLRSGLNLELRSHASPQTFPVKECPMCPYSSDSLSRLEEHINRQHLDLTSPSLTSDYSYDPSSDYASNFNCPICITSFPNSKDLELHVNIEHKDILSPAKGATLADPNADGADSFSMSIPSCPVCMSTSFKTNEDLSIHIEEHFRENQRSQQQNSVLTTPSPANSVSPDCPSSRSDRLLAKDIERHEKEVRKLQEQREFEMLRAQYGMDNQGNFREQSVTNMQRAVYAGEMSVADYYEKQIELRVAESSGIDDGSSCTRGLVPKVRALSKSCSNVISTPLCSTVDHYATTYGDRGWGCGYRNMQMMLSSLLQHTSYNELVYKAWSCSAASPSYASASMDGPSLSSMMSISRLQRTIEWAWSQGFDVQGAEQLGATLVNTRKWIGATEVVTLLSSLRIKCQLIDFFKPTGLDGSHPELFQWVLKYFQKRDDFKPPLYLQHQGHSRTIMGVEQLRDGTITMLVLDPSHSPGQMMQFNNTGTTTNAMRLIRKSMASMKARQYQVVCVVGIIDSEAEYQQSKVLHSMRIPQER